MLFPRLEYALPKERLATEAQSARETPRTPKTEDRMPAQPQKMKLQKRVGSEDCHHLHVPLCRCMQLHARVADKNWSVTTDSPTQL
jgi:hypothetical protein